MKRILELAVFLSVFLAWGCVDKKPEGTGLPAPQVGMAADTTKGKSKSELPAGEIELPEGLAAGESPTGGTPTPPTDTTKTQPVPTAPPAPSYVPEKKTQKLELLDLGDDKKGDGKKKSNGGGGSSKATRPKENPKRPAEYSAPTTLPAERTQSVPLPVAQGSSLTAGQLNSWQGLIRDATEKTSVATEVPKVIPRKKPTLACSDCAQALFFSYKYLVFHNDVANATKWYEKSKRFACPDRATLLASLIAASPQFEAFVTK